MDESRVIGLHGGIPWHIPGEQKRFKELTMGQTVLMGRKTYESLPPKVRPLPGRKNVIVTRDPAYMAEADVEVCHDVVERLREAPEDENIWIIGGAEIYSATLRFWDELYLTVVNGKHEGDAWFPEFEATFDLISEETAERCVYKRFKARK